ncbi:hypothetical protein [Mesorhizobium sp.]|uniref:hypothetical protein n=1 Tax=Mesorhizobium sp. TaxID=1871066 RepID=UPI0025BB7B19|nr:hypothetical protein [Mesorhizobium sp.]
MLRKRQQGHGRPMITALHDGHRVVVVGKRMVYSPRWRFVTDFLLTNLKTVLGPEWGDEACKKTPDHQLFRWLDGLIEAAKEAEGGVLLPPRGDVSALTRLAYALYLIEHNDKPQQNLLTRLRHPESFAPAVYEALVASAFAVAGARINGAEDGTGNSPKPEFFATFQNGVTYAVEAKRKQNWKSPFDLHGDEFRGELHRWLRDKLYKASKKALENPVYWFELGISAEIRFDQIDQLRELIITGIAAAEEITVKGRPPPPAYVFVTNNQDLVDDRASNLGFFALLVGFGMADFREGIVEIETAMDNHDKHRPMRWVHDCLSLVQRVPNSFDGVPDELLDDQGQPIETLRIGRLIRYPRSDGSEGVGRIREIASMDQEAMVVLVDEDINQQVFVKVPLTPQEAEAAKKFGNAIFGKPEGPQETIDEALRFYDRMLEIYANYDRKSLLNQVKEHRNFPEFEKLETDALRIRVAREITKSVV